MHEVARGELAALEQALESSAGAEEMAAKTTSVPAPLRRKSASRSSKRAGRGSMVPGRMTQA